MAAALALGSCGGGGGDGQHITPGGGGDNGCDGTCAQQALTVEDVQTVIAQAVAQAQSLGVAVTIAVTDRVGNVLAVFQMNGAPRGTKITACPGTQAQRLEECPPNGTKTGGLEGLVLDPDLPPPAVPAPGAALAAISKAGTAAYLSSQGNAFTTRTASQIVQQHFNPGERGQPGGPLFGVQFSQLPCGDMVTRFPEDAMTGPNRLPLGLSADPGAVPLYKPSTGPGKSGLVPVGAVGVEGVIPAGEDTPVYTLDPTITDTDDSPEEQIAVAAAVGFTAPELRRANRITVVGKSLRFVDDEKIAQVPTPPFSGLDGALVAVPAFCNAEVRPGTTLGQASSGILSTTFGGMPAEVLVDPAGNVRFPPTSATTPGGLTADEVTAILANGLEVIARTRAQIRNPLGTSAEVTVSVVGTDGTVLGQVRSPDAPVFGTDVSLQKARGAVLASSAGAAAQLAAGGTITYFDGTTSTFSTYLNGTIALLGRPDIFTGTIAFADRALGNLSRPFFPDGIDGNQNGSLSKPFPSQWSPFNTGLQLDLVFNGIQATVLALLGVQPQPEFCTLANPTPPYESPFPQVPNGIQIFPGSVPVYRGGQLVGGVGVSGDGVDQDDLISFLALHQAGEDTGTISNAPKAIRSDTLSVNGSFLRFVNCPVDPFLDSDRQGACDGL
jgi:uncharacterized protein GlcG (DUF336 family)